MNKTSMMQSLQQAWLHSHEEDAPGQVVYRPASYNFPPSRGRAGFELLPGQRLRRTGIAAADGPSQAEGHWQLRQENHSDVLTLMLPEQPAQLLQIVLASPERLVVKT